MWSAFSVHITTSALLAALSTMTTLTAMGAVVVFLYLSWVALLVADLLICDFLPWILLLSWRVLKRCLALGFAVLSFLLIVTGIILFGLGAAILNIAYFFLGKRASTGVRVGTRSRYSYPIDLGQPPPSQW